MLREKERSFYSLILIPEGPSIQKMTIMPHFMHWFYFLQGNNKIDQMHFN